MSKKSSGIIKIDNSGINSTIDKNPVRLGQPPKSMPPISADNASYAAYLARHNRLKQMIINREKDKNN